MELSDVVAAHKHSAKHRDELTQSDLAGCFYCLNVFRPKEIAEWVDWPEGTPEESELVLGTTALCPKCGIDSVIGSKAGYPITTAFLERMRRHWFGE
jgi:hypothetical protein